MGWTAGADRATGYLVTAANWNNYLGATGSLEYLGAMAHAEPARSLDTIYQNTAGAFKVVCVNLNIAASTTEYGKALIGSGTPPTTEVASVGHGSANPAPAYHTITFIVPPSWYYEIESTTGTPTLREWHEWN